jgi:hypothetical protein
MLLAQGGTKTLVGQGEKVGRLVASALLHSQHGEGVGYLGGANVTRTQAAEETFERDEKQRIRLLELQRPRGKSKGKGKGGGG